MTRLLAALPVRPADSDRVLLDRWAAGRDEAAFAELVRRHGPLVWGVCRRQLANPADAEDAFQAAFLVLARRADAVPGCVGAWLHRVAVLTCRNVRRANRRRPAVALPSDIPVSPPTDRLEVDDLLNRLPERDRRAVVLCHLLGFTRTEAAKELGVPEGTLSARLSRGLAKLRGREAALAVAAVPGGLSAATARAVGVWELSAAGLSPAATGAASGVIRMIWLKKLAAAVVVAGLVTAGVGNALGNRPVRVADGPPPTTPPSTPKAEAPNPKLLRPWQLTYWSVSSSADTVSTFALAADAGKLVVPPGGWGWQLSQVELVGDRLTARVTADPARPADFYLFEGRYDPAADRVRGCLYGRGIAGDVYPAEVEPIPAVRPLKFGEGMVSVFRDPDKPDWRAWMGLHEAWYAGWDVEQADADLLVDAHPADHPARKELVAKRDEARQKAADKLAAVRPLLPVTRQVAAADTRQGFAMTLSLIDFAGVADPTPAELAGWVDNALRFAGRYGDRYRDHLRLKLAGRMQWRNPHPEVALRYADQGKATTAADSWPRMEAEGARGHALEALGRAAEAAVAYAEYDRLHGKLNGPLANPAEVAAQRARLGDAAGRLNVAGVHVATFTGRVTTPDGKPVAGATVAYNGGGFDSFKAAVERVEPVRTDAAGRYTIAVRYTGRAMYNAALNVDAPGYVRRNQVRTGLQFLGTMTAVADVTLDPGEPLTGIVRLPPPKDGPEPAKPEAVVWSLVVTGPDGFTGYYDTEPGGRFRITLKPGRAYTVRVRRFGKKDLEVAGLRPGGPDVVLGWPLGK